MESARTRITPGQTWPVTDSQLANDRTFLAWLRTGIALFGLGFVVAKVAFLVDTGDKGVSDPALYSGVGILIVLCGAAVVIVGFRQHAAVERQFQGADLGGEREHDVDPGVRGGRLDRRHRPLGPHRRHDLSDSAS